MFPRLAIDRLVNRAQGQQHIQRMPWRHCRLLMSDVFLKIPAELPQPPRRREQTPSVNCETTWRPKGINTTSRAPLFIIYIFFTLAADEFAAASSFGSQFGLLKSPQPCDQRSEHTGAPATHSIGLPLCFLLLGVYSEWCASAVVPRPTVS